MFDNILHQGAVSELERDLRALALAPAMLFSGPRSSGKGTAALELARVLSCESSKPAAWNCSCPGCIRHRGLMSPDLLLLGRRSFFTEIAASSAAFQRGRGEGGMRLFIRSVRKLLARFSPVLWEDDPKVGKLSSLIGGMEEALEEFEHSAVRIVVQGSAAADTAAIDDTTGIAALVKLCDSIVKQAAKLEAEGVGELVPVAQIRRAAYWSHLAPLGRHKMVIIENAEEMQEGAKNSLLKILEEPPSNVTLVLTSSRPGSLLPTLLSRLRPYRFVQRPPDEEAEVLRRIFRAEDAAVKPGENNIAAYLESFLPVSDAALYALGAYFTASLSAAAALEFRRLSRPAPPLLLDLGKYAAAISSAGGFERSADAKTVIAHIQKTAENFEIPELFPQFCKNIQGLIASWLRTGDGAAEKAGAAELWKQALRRAHSAADTYNISVPMVLEGLWGDLTEALVGRAA